MLGFVWDYIRSIFHYWWVMLFVLVGAANTVWKWFHPDRKDFPIPHWMRVGIAVTAVIVAQTLVYRDSIKKLDRVIDEKGSLASENWHLKHPNPMAIPSPPLINVKEPKSLLSAGNPTQHQSASTRVSGNQNNAESVNQQGTGNFSQIGNGNSQINVGSRSPEERAKRKDIEDRLTMFLNEGNNLIAQCGTVDERPELKTLAENWAQRVSNYLASVRPSYAARFNSATGLSFSYTLANGKPMAELNAIVVNFMKAKTAALTKILEELSSS